MFKVLFQNPVLIIICEKNGKNNTKFKLNVINICNICSPVATSLNSIIFIYTSIQLII